MAAPRFALPGLHGLVVSDSLRGKVVYVDFWASWCEPCRRSFPWLKAMHEKYGSKGLVVVAINLDKERRAADDFLKKFTPPFTIAFDPEGKSAEAFDVSTMPSSFLINPTGMILSTHAGFDLKRTGEIEAEIQGACSK